jgi:beta-glucanase (GH16 family)
MNKLYAFGLFFSLYAGCSKKAESTNQAPPDTVGYTLSWSDDFANTVLDQAQWYHRIPGIRHDGFNDTTTVSVENGNLLLKVYSDTISGKTTHHTGMIATRKEFKYGKFEVRAAFSNEYGSWSAFWLQSATMGTPIGNPQLAGMEIDVVETLSNDGRVHHNLHWDGYGNAHKSAGLITADLGANSGQYHIYVLEWTPDYYKFYVDGQLTWTYQANISQRSEYIILSSEVKNYPAGTWAGPIPQKGYGSKNNTRTVMKVDYVKVYKLN